MLLDTKLSIHDLFSKLIAPENNQPAVHSITSEAKHSVIPCYSFTPSPNSLFSWRSPSRSSDSRINNSRFILGHGHCYNIHGFNLGNKWCSQKIFGKSKLASYKNSIVRLFDSKKLRNYQTPKILYNLQKKNYLVPSPSAAIGIRSTLKRTPCLLLSLGAARHYHSLEPKDYSKSARFFKHVKEHKILYMVGLGFVTIFLFGSWETIPYSKRKHFVIVPASRDKSVGKFLFRNKKEYFVLPGDHPDSVRARSISNQLLQALQRDLKIKEMSALEYRSKDVSSNVVEKKGVKVP